LSWVAAGGVPCAVAVLVADAADASAASSSRLAAASCWPRLCTCATAAGTAPALKGGYRTA
jgi:hypothetical protein